MPKAGLGDFQIHYEVHGEGPPVVLVSGLGGIGTHSQPLKFLQQHR